MYEENKYYHVYNRGCNKELIFQGQEDYEKLIRIIFESNKDEYLELYAFSLMPNHYHFLLKQISEKSVSKWIQYIFNKYVQWYNIKYDRKGTLFETAAKNKEIDSEKYLGLVTHYIHSNPKTEFQKKYSSLEFLTDDRMVCQKYYIDNFGSIDEYLDSYTNFLENRDIDCLDKYLF